MRFSIEYTLPRSASAIASASLQNFIISIGMVDEKYYYAGADRATLYIETFATSRLAITQLDMFNANGQVYSLRNYPQFQLSETNNATHFLIAFRPSAIRQDSAFYRNGPHGVNVSFLFTAAGTRHQQQVQEVGYVTFPEIQVRPDAEGASNNAAAADGNADTATATSGLSATVLVAIIAGCVVLAAGAMAAVAVWSTRRTVTQASSTKGEEVSPNQV